MSKRIKRSLFILGAFAIIIYTILFFHRAVNELSGNPIKIEHNLPDDYIDLFNISAWKKMVLQDAVSFKKRNMFASLIYDKRYQVEITKFNITPGMLLRNDITETSKKAKGDYPTSQMSFNETGFTTNYKAISQDTASKIYLSLVGSRIKTIFKNDSVICYNLKLKEMYMQFKPKGIYEIYIQSKKYLFLFTKEKPLTLIFLKKHNSLYFLLLTPKNSNEEINANLIYRLIKLNDL